MSSGIMGESRYAELKKRKFRSESPLIYGTALNAYWSRASVGTEHDLNNYSVRPDCFPESTALQ